MKVTGLPFSCRILKKQSYDTRFQCCVFKLITLVNVITLKTKQHAVNALRKQVSQQALKEIFNFLAGNSVGTKLGRIFDSFRFLFVSIRFDQIFGLKTNTDTFYYSYLLFKKRI